MLQRRHLLLLAVVVLTAIAVASVLPPDIFRAGVDVTTVDFPDKAEETVDLDGDTTRFTTTYPNGTRRYAIEHNADGSLSEYWYRPNGTLQEAITRSEEIDGVRVLLRHATLAEDGVTYKQDKEFYLSGEPSKLIVLLDDTTLWRRHFFENGVVHKDARVEFNNGTWTLVSQETRRENDSLAERFKRFGEFGSSLTERFDEEGTLAAKLELTRTQYSGTYQETWYFPGQSIVQRLVEQTASKTTITVKRMDGTIDHRVDIHGDMAEATFSVWRHFFDASGNKTMEQWWDYKDGHLALDLTKIFREDGSELFYAWFNKETGTITTTVDFHSSEDNNLRTIKRYREEDGTLEEIDEMGEKNVTLSEVKYPEGNDIIATIDPAWIVPIDYPLPPQMIEHVPAQGP